MRSPKHILLFLILVPLLCPSQSKLEEGFNNLVNKTWFSKGTWKSGAPFFQEISLKYGLDKNIVVTSTKSMIIKDKTSKYIESAHGIRRFNTKKDEIEFWEFDIRGQLTTGRVIVEGKNIWYKYKYGDEVISDFWQYENDNYYKLTVGVYNDGKWKKKYLETELINQTQKQIKK